MSRLTLTYFATYHNSPKFPSANGAGAKVNLSDENVDFLSLDEVRELKGAVAGDDGNLKVRHSQYSYKEDTSDSETVTLELAARERTSCKWDEKTISQYYRQRHYDPNPAQFVSEDPLGFDGGDKNLYGYVGNSPVNYTDPTGLIAEGFLDTLGNKLEGAAYEIAGFVVRNVHEPVGRSLADNYALESALRTGDSIAVGVAQTGNFVGFDIREFREDLYGEEVNDNLNETIVTISTAGTLVLGGFALSAYAAGSAAFNATATAAINVGLINAGIGLTTQLIFNGGDSSELDYGSLALDFGFGTLGSFVGAGVAAKTGGGLVSRIAASTAFEGAFAGGEQVVRNLANGDSWSQDVRSAILSSILLQGGSEILSNGREVLQAGRRFLRAGDNLVDDLLGAFDNRFSLATPNGANGRELIGIGDVSSSNVNKGGDLFAIEGRAGGSGNISSFDLLNQLSRGKTLLVGEGNLSFSANLARQQQINPSNITASIYETQLSDLARVNASALEESGARVLSNVDARNLSNSFGSEKFDAIIFNNPNTGIRPAQPSTKGLLRGFFLSARDQISDNGTVIVTLKNSKFYRGFRVEEQAKQAGFRLINEQVIDLAQKVPGFSHAQTKNLSRSARFPNGSVQYTFIRGGN